MRGEGAFVEVILWGVVSGEGAFEDDASLATGMVATALVPGVRCFEGPDAW